MRAAEADGAAAQSARADKEAKYPEIKESNRCQLVVVALETGGRWAQEAWDFIEELAWAKALEAQPAVRKAAVGGWARRWRRMLATSAASAFASSLVAPAGSLGCWAAAGPEPFLDEVVADRGQ